MVITIIVLLILAGVSINLVVGDNGVLKQATNASKKSKQESEAELAETQVEYIVKGDNAGKIDLTKTKKKIDKLDEVSKTEFVENESETQLKITFKDGKEHFIKGVRNNFWEEIGLSSENVLVDVKYVSQEPERWEFLNYFILDESGEVLNKNGVLFSGEELYDLIDDGTFVMGEDYVAYKEQDSDFRCACKFESDGKCHMWKVNDDSVTRANFQEIVNAAGAGNYIEYIASE